MKKIFLMLIVFSDITIAYCQGNNEDSALTQVGTVALAKPFATPSVKNYSKIIGWPADKTPVAPRGFSVTRFVTGINDPRWIYVADNGDVFIAAAEKPKQEGSHKNTDCILRFSNIKDGIPQTRSVYLKGLNQPLGMLIIKDKFYVANTDAVIEFPYHPNDTAINTHGKEIVPLPLNGRHWTRNIISNATGDKIFIAVGSGSNVAENGIGKEARRACILEVNTDGTGEKLYASGLRNPVGMALAPYTHVLWTAVNERDEIGDELVPDYLTSVKEGGFYGWPYSYFGQHEDPRMKGNERPDLVKRAIVPDVSLDSHTASLGLAFYSGKNFPEKYTGGAFIGQHGSWNRSQFTGYKIVFVPFKNGDPIGKPEDFLTGFIADENKKEVYGRPVGVAISKDGSLLVADDAGNVIWRVVAK